MDHPNFQVPPPPPQAPAFVQPPAQPAPVAAPVATETATDALPSHHFAAALGLSANFYKTKVLGTVLLGLLVLGMAGGALMFGGSKAPQKQQSGGLTGVVHNPDLKEKLSRCGLVPESYPCLLYLMNYTRNDRQAEYFFEEAAKRTGRQKFLIQIDNQNYGKTLIRAGRFAEIKIPPLR